MSKLKAFELFGNSNGEPIGIDKGYKILNLNYKEVYLKSEADKVINKLKAQKAQAEDDCAYWKMSEGNAVNAMHETEEYAMQLYKELRHQKYKRCLAMAWWCSAELGMLVSTWEFKIKHYKKWQKRWLELAEKFKEAK